MKAISLRAAAAAVGAVFDSDVMITDICTDSRRAAKGSIFVAIEGDRLDGHCYVASALANGAEAAVCHKDPGCGGNIIYVNDTRRALLDLAEYYRGLFSFPVVGITGSVGKTTTKEMVYAVLSQKYKTHKNEGNFNNEIGLPQTVFKMDDSFEAAILEMGMSNFGEISRLTKVAKPDVAIISKIGVSHIEHLGSRENILKAKLEILEGLKKGGALIVNGDDDLLSGVKCDNHPVIRFGIDAENNDFRATSIKMTDKETSFTAVYRGATQQLVIPTVGRHNVYNALSAFAVGIQLGVPPQEAADGLSQYAALRQIVRNVNGIIAIEDFYNASPDSVRAAIEALKSVKANSFTFVFGDMLELGAISDTAHKEMGVLAAKSGVDRLFTFGEKAALAADSAKENGIKLAQSFNSKKLLAKKLASELKVGDAVLFKASHGMRFGEIFDAFLEIKEGDAAK